MTQDTCNSSQQTIKDDGEDSLDKNDLQLGYVPLPVTFSAIIFFIIFLIGAFFIFDEEEPLTLKWFYPAPQSINEAVYPKFKDLDSLGVSWVRVSDVGWSGDSLRICSIDIVLQDHFQALNCTPEDYTSYHYWEIDVVKQKVFNRNLHDMSVSFDDGVKETLRVIEHVRQQAESHKERMASYGITAE